MDIKNRITGEVIYYSDHKTMRKMLETAVKSGAYLSGANLWGANLSGADLAGANLSGANLSGANLSEADLRGANLSEADLFQANLWGADLREANLREANLREANLREANLREANLREANLREANLSGAYLRGANLSGAYLSWTCLDPDAQLPAISDEEITQAGLEIDGDWVYGWRTKRSQVVGNAIYEPGIYTAPVFSVDTETSCHPGIYIAGEAWLRDNYPGTDIVRCRCRRIELLHAGDKWRCKQLEVLE